MSLAPVELPGSPSTTYEASSTSSPPSKPTVATALSLLQSLKPQIMEILGQEKLRVTLDRMDIMRSGRDDSENAHVMWVGPSLESPDARRLKRVCDMLQNAYLDAGLLVDARRPLKLHCTVLNTVYRMPRSAGRRQPFSYPAVLASPAFCAIGGVPSTMVGPRAVDLGAWDVDEVQICEMGSHGPENEYVSCGGVSLP